MSCTEGDTDHNIKIEINIRKQYKNMRSHFTILEYLGISMLVAKREYLFACKLMALMMRHEIAMRDVYDIHFFAKNNWDIDTEVLQIKTNKKTVQYLQECIEYIEKIKNNQILQGLGELLSPKEKLWVKKYLIDDTIFMLRNYISIFK